MAEIGVSVADVQSWWVDERSAAAKVFSRMLLLRVVVFVVSKGWFGSLD